MRWASDRWGARAIAGAGALIATLSLAACGGSNTNAGTASVAAQTTGTGGSATAATSTTTPGTTSSSSTTTSTTTSAATATPPGCRPDQLRLTASGGGAATGHFARTLVLTDTAATSCTMYGYPGLQLIGADGRPMDVPVRRGGGFAFSDPGPHLVTLAPARSASFQFGGVSVSQPGGQACPAVSGVKVIPPNDYAQLSAAVQAVACPGEGVTVSAVAASSSAGG